MLSRLTTWPRFLDSLAYRKASFDGDLRIIRHPYKQPKKEGARQGLSISAIAARLNMDRKTIRKYIKDGVQAPRYGPRAPRPCVVDPFVSYVTERVRTFPELSVERLLREVRAMGYKGGRTALGDLVREVRPPRQRGFEVRFETAAGHQAQVDFAHFNVEFDDRPWP
jgi:transposase